VSAPEYRSPYPAGCICAGPTLSEKCPVHGTAQEQVSAPEVEALARLLGEHTPRRTYGGVMAWACSCGDCRHVGESGPDSYSDHLAGSVAESLMALGGERLAEVEAQRDAFAAGHRKAVRFAAQDRERAEADLAAAEQRGAERALREAAVGLPTTRHRGKANDPATRAAIGRWLEERAAGVGTRAVRAGGCGSCLACDPPHTGPSGFPGMRMYVCATCGNKRCPAAGDCLEWECSGSNDPDQGPPTPRADRLATQAADPEAGL
jgi:hypothetical protein